MRVPILLLLWSTSLVASASLPDPASCTDELTAYMEAIETGGKREAYLCLAARDDAAAALLERMAPLGEEDSNRIRLSRALAVHTAQRLDRLIPVEHARAMGAVDRRLLRDAIQARRGRETPVAEHKMVFEQFDWYEPDDGFNPSRLTELDLANLAMVDKPPPEPKPEKPESASAAVAEAAAPAEGTGVETWCGCQAPVGVVGLGWLAGLGLLAMRRRKRG